MKTISGKIYFATLLVVLSLLAQSAYSQHYAGLDQLSGGKGTVYYSKGHEDRARSLANMVEDALQYGERSIAFRPAVTLLVLSPDDWNKHTSFPVYGMAHYKDDQTLVVASSDNDLWRSFIPPLGMLPEGLAESIRKTYRSGDGKLSMQPFFDLLALHELGHAYHIQGGLKMQRKWMGELFCNVLLHTYIAEKQPALLDALTVFPQMVTGSGTQEYLYTSLADFEQYYVELGTKHPKNYGWYQCGLHNWSRLIYDAAGPGALQKLWNTLKRHQEELTNEQFADVLKKEVHSSVADVYLKWEQ